MKLEDWRKQDTIEAMKTVSTEANEATKSTFLTGTLLGHICRQDNTYTVLQGIRKPKLL